MKKKAIWIVLVAVAAVGLYLAIAGRRKPEAKYRTTAVDRGNITQTVTASGALSAVTTVQVGSQVSGIIAKLHADFNSKVKKGDLLAELDPTPFQAQVEQQRASVTKAVVDTRNSEITFNRQKRLLDEGLAAQSDYDGAKAAYDAARAQVDQAKAGLSQAETNLKYTKIASPIDGIVVARQFDVGQTVAASFQAPTLFTIAQDLPGAAAPGGAPGAGGGAPGAATRQFNQTRGGGGPGGGGPGGGGKFSGTRRTQSNVYLLAANGELKPVQIRTGISDGRNTEAVSGDLKPGDPVVIGLATAKASTAGAPPGGQRRGF